MHISTYTRSSIALILLFSAIARAQSAIPSPADPNTAGAQSIQDQFAELNAKILTLEAKQNENWMTQQRTQQIKAIVKDVLADAATRSQFADSSVGYNNGFFLQDSTGDFKLTIGGYVQIRYDFAQLNATNNRTILPRVAGSPPPADPANASGFGVRKARVTFTGNLFGPDITYKLEGDFYAGASGGFTATDVYAAYRFNPALQIRAGSFKVPFAKSELTSDPLLSTQERPEILAPFDPVRAIGVSLYGDLIANQLAYEINANNGAQTNTFRRPDTVGPTANLDNRLAFYARLQWAGSGKISDFADEADFRPAPDNNKFVWLLGGAVGYESQNATNNSLPAPQTTTLVSGLSNGDGPGFTTFTLNGDLLRATVDFSAKYQGLAFNTAAYFQQVNANTGNTSTTSAALSTGPFGKTDASFFQTAAYAQVGYFVIPQKLELIARAGLLLTEGYPNAGELYTLGANYYLYGQNLKIQFDATYTPEAPFTDTATGLQQNAQEIITRIQLQAKF